MNHSTTDRMIPRILAAAVLIVAISTSVAAQTATVTGTVTSTEEGEGVTGASVRIGERGAVTRSDGSFVLRDLAAGEHRITVSSIGFETLDTLIVLAPGDSTHIALVLEPDEHEIEEIVVTGTRTQRRIDDVPVRVEAVPQEEVEEKLLMAPSNVSMLLNESAGMRVQTTSPATGTANLRIQGLPGRYTQLLTDGIPNVGGLSAGFGLTELPPLNLRQVEIIKGAASALYGADAIAGVVNFITKDPRPDLEISALFNATTQEGFDVAAYSGQQLGAFGYTLMTSRNTQPRVDVDDDGFADVPESERYAIYPKLRYALSEALSIELGGGYISDERLGGSMEPFDTVGSNLPYFEHVVSERISGTAGLEWRIAEGSALTVKGAAMRLERDATYGRFPFAGTQTTLYGEAIYSTELERHRLLFGAAYGADRFTIERSPVIRFGPADRGYSYTAPAVLIQDEVAFSDHFATLASARVDFHSEFGTFFTPRVSLMLKPTEGVTLRIGGGTGFKAPTIFVEEAEARGFSDVALYPGTVAETAQNLTLDVNWGSIIAESVGFNINAATYFTRVKNALVFLPPSGALDEPSWLGNADGDLTSRGGEVTTKLNYEDFKLSLGYTYLFATQEDRGERYELALNPRHAIGAVLMWESDDLGAKVGFETYWTGVQRLEDHPSRTSSPSYVVMGLVAEKAFGPVRLFINFENFTDTRQTRYERIIVGDASTSSVRTLPIYAPLEGRVINGGVRFVL
jgi:outer membrane receptor for ferrienterochelin and colicins